MSDEVKRAKGEKRVDNNWLIAESTAEIHSGNISANDKMKINNP